jgi:hypothetical protein
VENRGEIAEKAQEQDENGKNTEEIVEAIYSAGSHILRVEFQFLESSKLIRRR